jgi:hypothetical protein
MGLKPIVFETKIELECLGNFTKSAKKNVNNIDDGFSTTYFLRWVEIQFQLLDWWHCAQLQGSVVVVRRRGQRLLPGQPAVGIQSARQPRWQRRLRAHALSAKHNWNRARG